MAAPRKSNPDPTVLAAAEALTGPLRLQVKSSARDLADKLEISEEIAAAALADVLATTVAVPALKAIGRDAVAASGMGKSAAYQVIADLGGATRQAVSLRLSEPKD